MGMGIKPKLGNGNGNKKEWEQLHGNGGEWELKIHFGHLYTAVQCLANMMIHSDSDITKVRSAMVDCLLTFVGKQTSLRH